jgi:uncharacterized membrane protein
MLKNKVVSYKVAEDLVVSYSLYRILINLVLPYIYTIDLTISISLFFNPLGYSLLRFNISYILVAALTFRLRFSYKVRVFRLQYLFSNY